MQVFDTSTNDPGYVHSVEISVCDASGIFLLLDKSVYRGESLKNQPPEDNLITTTLRTYNRGAKWEPLAKDLEQKVRAQWPGLVQVQFPPLKNVSYKRMALPDRFRSEIEQECRAAPEPRPYYCQD